MRLIDADALYDKAEAWYKNAPTPYRKIYRSFIDIIADAPTITPPPNAPLTLEELREMDGEPVWVEHCNGGEYVIVAWNIHDEIAGARQARLAADNYDNGSLGDWIAYRRRPEGGDPNA